MLIKQKYDYKTLERVATPNGRRYIVGEGRTLPSITHILDSTADKSHLKEWADRVGIIEANKIKTEAANLGTGMHKNLENYILGSDLSGSFMDKALAKVIIKNGLSKVTEIWGTEIALYYPDLFAGTTDNIGIFDGLPAIIDFKNSLRDKKKEWITDYFCQLTAYASCHNIMYGTEINCGVVMIATRDAKYQEFVIKGDEFKYYENLWFDKVYSYYETVEIG